MNPPRALIIAGPNGAGKTTFAKQFLPREGGLTRFINADLIAAGLSPFAPETMAVRAAKLMVEAMGEMVRKRADFAIETTLSGRSYLGLVNSWQAIGYRVGLVFLTLPSPELAIQRVRLRVRQGGHDIPEDVIRRRFERGWLNFESAFKPLVDDWRLYDASVKPAFLIDKGKNP